MTRVQEPARKGALTPLTARSQCHPPSQPGSRFPQSSLQMSPSPDHPGPQPGDSPAEAPARRSRLLTCRDREGTRGGAGAIAGENSHQEPSSECSCGDVGSRPVKKAATGPWLQMTRVQRAPRSHVFQYLLQASLVRSPTSQGQGKAHGQSQEPGRAFRPPRGAHRVWMPICRAEG